MLDLKKEITLLEGQKARLQASRKDALDIATKCELDLYHVEGALQILSKLVKLQGTPQQPETPAGGSQ